VSRKLQKGLLSRKEEGSSVHKGPLRGKGGEEPLLKKERGYHSESRGRKERKTSFLTSPSRRRGMKGEGSCTNLASLCTKEGGRKGRREKFSRCSKRLGKRKDSISTFEEKRRTPSSSRGKEKSKRRNIHLAGVLVEKRASTSLSCPRRRRTPILFPSTRKEGRFVY